MWVYVSDPSQAAEGNWRRVMGAKKTLAAWVAKYVKNFTVEKVLASILRPVGRRVSSSEAKSLGAMWSMPLARTGPAGPFFLSTT